MRCTTSLVNLNNLLKITQITVWTHNPDCKTSRHEKTETDKKVERDNEFFRTQPGRVPQDDVLLLALFHGGILNVPKRGIGVRAFGLFRHGYTILVVSFLHKLITRSNGRPIIRTAFSVSQDGVEVEHLDTIGTRRIQKNQSRRVSSMSAGGC